MFAAGNPPSEESPSMPAQSQSLLPDWKRVAGDVRQGAITSTVVETAYYFLKGLCCSPSGHRLAGGVQEVVTSAPDIACGAAKFGIEKGIESVVAHGRQKDDYWNPVVAYGSAAALFSVHVVGPLSALSYGLHEAAIGDAFCGFLHLFRLDHRCRLPEPAPRHAAGFPGFPPVTPIVVEVVWADESGGFQNI